MEIQVRPAVADDWPIIAEFNCRLAEESEAKKLDRETVDAGVRALLADGRKGRYLLAVIDGRVVGQLMHTFEWSDWRNGDIWWLQSVYVETEFRRHGVFRTLYEHLRHEAEANPGVVGLRLYVEDQNTRAHETYFRLGMQRGGYFVLEQMFRRQPGKL